MAHQMQPVAAAENVPRNWLWRSAWAAARPACLPALLQHLQMELQRVLYPVFVHVYLQLVQYGASHTAAELLKQYK
jgi:hypothetical protein